MVKVAIIREEKAVKAEVYVGNILEKEYKAYLQNKKTLKERIGYK